MSEKEKKKTRSYRLPLNIHYNSYCSWPLLLLLLVLSKDQNRHSPIYLLHAFNYVSVFLSFFLLTLFLWAFLSKWMTYRHGVADSDNIHEYTVNVLQFDWLRDLNWHNRLWNWPRSATININYCTRTCVCVCVQNFSHSQFCVNFKFKIRFRLYSIWCAWKDISCVIVNAIVTGNRRWITVTNILISITCAQHKKKHKRIKRKSSKWNSFFFRIAATVFVASVCARQSIDCKLNRNDNSTARMA